MRSYKRDGSGASSRRRRRPPGRGKRATSRFRKCIAIPNPENKKGSGADRCLCRRRCRGGRFRREHDRARAHESAGILAAHCLGLGSTFGRCRPHSRVLPEGQRPMKTVSKILAASATCAAFFLPCPIASSKEAKVTQIIHEVKLVPENAAARDASLNDKVSEDTGVRTGGDSRSELTFPDLTITRLGANTVFSFNKSGRTANIDSGSILLRVPKNSGGGSIRSSAVTVAITGTTVIFETDSMGGN